jgi:hypothetical protein
MNKFSKARQHLSKNKIRFRDALLSLVFYNHKTLLPFVSNQGRLLMSASVFTAAN